MQYNGRYGNVCMLSMSNLMAISLTVINEETVAKAHVEQLVEFYSF